MSRPKKLRRVQLDGSIRKFRSELTPEELWATQEDERILAAQVAFDTAVAMAVSEAELNYLRSLPDSDTTGKGEYSWDEEHGWQKNPGRRRTRRPKQ